MIEDVDLELKRLVVDLELKRFAKEMNQACYGDPPKQKRGTMIKRILRFCFRRTVNRIENEAIGWAIGLVWAQIFFAEQKLSPSKKFTANYYAKATANRILFLMRPFKLAPENGVKSIIQTITSPQDSLNLSFRTVERKPKLKPIAIKEISTGDIAPTLGGTHSEEVKP